jgi:hypothetical protein
MNARRYYPAVLASCVALFAIGAGAQTPSTSTASPATSATAPASSTAAPATSGSEATSEQQSAQGAVPAKKTTKATKTTKTAKTTHHTKEHNATHATQRSQPPASSEESQYRTALRQCVQGQASRRNQCLDDAIARYGRS